MLSIDERHQRLLNKYGVAPPWPYVRPAEAAKVLGVDIKYITGLACSRDLPAVKGRTKDGKIVWFIQKDAVNALAVKLGREPITDTRLLK